MNELDVKPPPPHWKRAALWAFAGVAVFAAGMWLTRAPAEVQDTVQVAVVSATRGAPRSAGSTPQAPLELAALAFASPPLSRLNEHVTFNPFAALTLAPAVLPASAPRPAPPPKRAPEFVGPPLPPVAPTLPFTVVGSITGAQVTGDQPVAFVKQQDQLLVLHTGDTIAQTYRVESITPQRIEFMYLPLMQRQTLALAP
jgi:hypothetical protein